MQVIINFVFGGAGVFYATNNPFLENGPKGFSELKTLENGDLFVRMDFPGVPNDSVKIYLHPSKNALAVFANAPKEHKHDPSHRKYGAKTGLLSECCEISGITSHMSDGVLRLLLSKTHIQQDPSSILLNFFSSVI